MKEWLDYNNILAYSTHNEGKSVIAERSTKTLKAKIYKKKVTANYSKFYLAYLNKLIDKYNNTYKTYPKTPKFEVNDRVTITKYKNIFIIGYTEN